MKPIFLVALAIGLSAADWPRFRGPNGSGTVTANGVPTEFGPSKNMAWKTPVPFGRSSPIVVGSRVFLTASEGGELLTLAYDVGSGRELWRRAIKPSKIREVYKANDAASATPAADAKSVFVFFPDFGLIAYSFEGKERWRRPLGPFENFYGMAASPIVENGLVVLLCDQVKGSFVAAFDAATGKQRWRAERPESTEGWSTPIVHDGQLITVGSTRVEAYHLSTGEKRWWTSLPSAGAMGTASIHKDTVLVNAMGVDKPWIPAFAGLVASLDKNKDGMLSKAESAGESTWFEHFGWVDSNSDGLISAAEWDAARQYGVGEYGAVAIPLGGKGKLESSALRWRMKRNLPYVPAPVLYEGIYYMIKDGGIITSLDPSTGEILKQGRSPQALGEYFASPVAADGKVFAVNSEGKMTVLRAGAQWEVLAVNELGDEAYATPAISGNRILVRTRGMLYGFGGK